MTRRSPSCGADGVGPVGVEVVRHDARTHRSGEIEFRIAAGGTDDRASDRGRLLDEQGAEPARGGRDEDHVVGVEGGYLEDPERGAPGSDHGHRVGRIDRLRQRDHGTDRRDDL